MKKNISILLTVLCVLVISTLILFAEEVKYDFRKTNWGMSKEEVKATEDKKPGSEIDNTIAYRVKIDGDEYICGYTFLEDKLYNAGYVFTGKHSNRNLYIDDYKRLKEILIKKYGKPKDEIVFWSDDLFKNDRSQWGLAVSIGDLSYGAGWETPTTKIELMLWGDNYKISLVLAYDSRELEEWANKILEEKAKSKF
ncbi:hypothetical protein ES708_28384 [subsurface metagenome]